MIEVTIQTTPAPPRRRGNPVGWVVFFGFLALIMWIVLSYVSVW